jgi:hypothetical protein
MEYRNILSLLVAFSIHQVLVDCCVVCHIFFVAAVGVRHIFTAASKIEVVSAITISEATPCENISCFYGYTVVILLLAQRTSRRQVYHSIDSLLIDSTRLVSYVHDSFL